MPTWTDGIEYLPTREPVRPGQVMVPAEEADAARDVLGGNGIVVDVAGGDEGEPGLRLARLQGVPDGQVAEALGHLRDAGIAAQPNHVLFATAVGPDGDPSSSRDPSGNASDVYDIPPDDVDDVEQSCGPHPATGDTAPWIVTSKVVASPLHASPLHASGYLASGERRSTAVPDHDAPATPPFPAGSDAVVVAVIDTGLARDDVRPAALGALTAEDGDDVPDVDGPAESPVRLDPVAGHGSFIAGVIKTVEPQALVRNIKLVGPCGDVDERTLADRIRALATDDEPHPHVLNLSIAGYGAAAMRDLELAIGELRERGTVVVAAAGNDGTCRRTYPAAIEGVVGVGAVDVDGRPAPFTNFGDWVVACAHGVDVTSTFFTWDGEDVDTAGRDVDDFPGWAVWSGTSFAAPLVAGLVARAMVAAHLAGAPITASEAKDAVLAAGTPIPSLGVHVTA